MTENKAFQDQIKTKILDINNLIDQKCKKSVINVYESKISKIESDFKNLIENIENRPV